LLLETTFQSRFFILKFLKTKKEFSRNVLNKPLLSRAQPYINYDEKLLAESDGNQNS
jgi:hypothetical protein